MNDEKDQLRIVRYGCINEHIVQAVRFLCSNTLKLRGFLRGTIILIFLTIIERVYKTVESFVDN